MRFALLPLLPAAALRGHGPDEELIGCTAIAMDGAATLHGGAFAGMNADSGDGDTRLTFVPPKVHGPGVMRPVYTFNLSYPRFVGYGRGDFFHPFEGHRVLYEPVGFIPEVNETFGYYEATEPLMNERGLGFGESSCGAFLMNKFPGESGRDVPTGLLDTVTLMMLALERCSTARCAVELMGRLSEEFGFVPTPGEPTAGVDRRTGRAGYADAGEGYTIADASGEAWVFHVLGGVTGITKSVWAAQRVPKGHFAMIANEFVIGELPTAQTEDFLFNRQIFQAAQAAGLWDGSGPLHFSRVFSPVYEHFEYPLGSTPIPLYAALRRWNLMNMVAPSLKLPFRIRNDEYPFSVPVETQYSHRDVMALFRTQYEGTEWDMTKGMLAGPFGNPFHLEGGPKYGQVPRGVSIARTLYGIIADTSANMSVAWLAMDAPTTSVYVPLFAGASKVSSQYSTGHHQVFSRDSAWWVFNFVSNHMGLNYEQMSRNEVYPKIAELQNEIDLAIASIGPSTDLDSLQIQLQQHVFESWWKLADFLIMKYNDGKTNVPHVGSSWAYPEWYAQAVGFTNDVHPLWVSPKSTGAATSLPKHYDNVTGQWWGEQAAALFAEPPTAAPFFGQVAGAVTLLLSGILIGRASERRGRRQDARMPLL